MLAIVVAEVTEVEACIPETLVSQDGKDFQRFDLALCFESATLVAPASDWRLAFLYPGLYMARFVVIVVSEEREPACQHAVA